VLRYCARPDGKPLLFRRLTTYVHRVVLSFPPATFALSSQLDVQACAFARVSLSPCPLSTQYNQWFSRKRIRTKLQNRRKQTLHGKKWPEIKQVRPQVDPTS
ncbi:unnamed protein product, partial [Ectocarpus sp. 12 AP-2014]